MSLDILLLSKNNEKYFKYVFPNLLQELATFDYNFYIYENNSSDATKTILLDLQKKNSKIHIYSEVSANYINRYLNITLARNRLVELYLASNISHHPVIWLDTNIIFSKKSIDVLLESYHKHPEGKMFGAFTCHDINLNYYYDILAYNYGKYFRTSMSPVLSFDKILLESQDNIDEKLASVDTAFGGLVIMSREILVKFKWKFKKPIEVKNLNIRRNIICEHWYFCQLIKTCGKIYIVKDANAFWFGDSVFQDINKFEKLKLYLINRLNN